MLPSYKVGYTAGWLFTRMVKFYLIGKVINTKTLKIGRLAKNHKIDSKNPEIVTENIFNYLEYID